MHGRMHILSALEVGMRHRGAGLLPHLSLTLCRRTRLMVWLGLAWLDLA